MSKTTVASTKIKRKAKTRNKQSLDDLKPSFAEEINNAIEIKIVHLEIQEGEVEAGVMAQLSTSFGSHQVGLLDNIQLPTMGGRIPLDYCCCLQLPELDDAAMDTLISIPLFFCLMTKPEIKKPAMSSMRKSTNDTGGSLKKEYGGIIIGQGNLDILPLILGQGRHEEVVKLELGGYIDTLFFQRTTSDHPRILVQLLQINDWIPKVKLNNVMWLTVESIFNPGEPYLGMDFGYTAVFPIPYQEVDIRSFSELSQEPEQEGETRLDCGVDEGRGDGQTCLDSRGDETLGDLAFVDCATSPMSTAGSNWTERETADPSSVGSAESFVDGRQLSSDYTSSLVLDDMCNISAHPTSSESLLLDATKQQKKKFDRSDSGRKATSEEKILANQKLSILKRILDYKLIEFPLGCWHEVPDVDLRKTWSTLASIPGGPSKHSSRVCSDSSGLFSKFRVDLKKKMSAEREPRVVWNMMRPLWLDQESEQIIIRRIYKYGVWPIEFVVNENPGAVERYESSDWKGNTKYSKAGKKKKTYREEQKNVGVRSFIAWVDLSTLLFPGTLTAGETEAKVESRTQVELPNCPVADDSVRVAGQLQIFDKDEAEELWGLTATFMAKPAESFNRIDPILENPNVKKKGKGELRKDSTGKDEAPLHGMDSTFSSETRGQGNPALDAIDQENRFQFLEGSLEHKYEVLQQEYNKLKDKYNRILNSASGSSADDDEQFQDLETLDENEESKMLLQTKDIFEEWSKAYHKKLLLKRYALASMLKKKQEKIMINQREMLSSENEPTFVVVEIKLLKPLIPKKSTENIETDIKEFLPNRKDEKAVPRKRFFQDELKSSIYNICKLITQEYQDYTKFSEYEGCKTDVNTKFYEHLERSKVHCQISESLREILSSYLVDTVGMPVCSSEYSMSMNEDYIDWYYCQVMDKVHSVVNNYVIDADRSTPQSFMENLPKISWRENFIFATEAAEEGDYDRAKLYLSKVLKGDGLQFANNWFHYAVITMRMGDHSKTVECLREALLLDIRHKESLIMYAVLLTSAGMFEVAELFFYAVIDFYPYFTEGWIIFHLFYILIERKIGTDTTLIMGIKCHNEFFINEPFKPPQLAWDNSSPSKGDSIFMHTAVYLLSLNLSEMTEICLAQDLECLGKKSHLFNYYLAVSHHIQGHYEESSHHIHESFDYCQEVRKDASLWIILGHNKWKLGKKGEAVKMYQEAFSSGTLAKMPHMALVRCGYYFLDCEKPELAKNMFIMALKENKSPQVWLGLGLALYALNTLDDAELALQEANVLDNQLAIAWAYLGLICLHRNQLIHSHQCFIEAKRCGLNDESIEEKIKSLSKCKYKENKE